MTLPLPPSINHQYATVNGRRVLSAKGRKYKALVAQHVFLTLRTLNGRDRLLETLRTALLELSIQFVFPSLLRRDLDGGLKITQDALCEALDINDNRILAIMLSKHCDPSNPRIEITLSPCRGPMPGPARNSSSEKPE